jgi:hypothetical protein
MITKFYKNGKVFDSATSEVVFRYDENSTLFKSKKGNFWTLNEDTLEVSKKTEVEAMDLYLNQDFPESEGINEYFPKLKQYIENLEEV